MRLNIVASNQIKSILSVGFYLFLLMFQAGCRNPTSIHFKSLSVGAHLEEFIKESNLRPIDVVDKESYKIFIFETNRVVEKTIASDSTLRFSNIENTAPPVLFDSPRNLFEWEPSRAVPGSVQQTHIYNFKENRRTKIFIYADLKNIVLKFNFIDL